MGRQVTVAEFFAPTTAWIDYNEFKPLSDQEWALMWRCTGHVGFLSLWVPGSEHTFSLPEKAQRLILNAIDHLERGYWIEICWAKHPNWPGRTFTYVVANAVERNAACSGARSISKQFIYEVPTGDPVPLTLLLKKVADSIQFWSWQMPVARFAMGVAAFSFVAGLGLAVLPNPHHDDFSIWLRLGTFIVLGVGFPALLLKWLPNSGNRYIRETKEMASKL